jgi:hypothetical protein
MGSLCLEVIYMLLRLKMLNNKGFVVVGSIILRMVVEIIILKKTIEQSFIDCP